MIKLQIPVENEDDIINMPLNAEKVGQLLPRSGPDLIPDLILSATNGRGGQGCQRTPRRNAYSVPATLSDYLKTADTEIVLEPKDILLHSDISADCRFDGSDQSEERPTVVRKARNSVGSRFDGSDKYDRSFSSARRESFKSGKMSDAVSDNGHRPLRRRRHLERNLELATDNAAEDEYVIAEHDNKSDSSSFITNKKDNTASYKPPKSGTSCLPSSETTDESDVEQQFLLALNNEITRVAKQPIRSYVYEAKSNEDETWC